MVKTPSSSDVTRIADAAVRQHVTVAGKIISVTVNPKNAPPALTARVEDSSGSIDAVFVGRRGIAGIEPGRAVTVTGRVYDDGHGPCIFNPSYELLNGTSA